MSYKVLVLIDDEGPVELDGVEYSTYTEASDALVAALDTPTIGPELMGWYIKAVNI